MYMRKLLGPIRFYIYDREPKKKATFLFTSNRELEKLPLVKMHPVVIKSRDGLDLVSYLTLPKWADPEGDGIPNEDDLCPDSILDETIIIDGCDFGVENLLLEDGCTISDLIVEIADEAKNHGKFVSGVAHLLKGLKKDGLISGKEKGAIQSCAAQSDIP